MLIESPDRMYNIWEVVTIWFYNKFVRADFSHENKNMQLKGVFERHSL